ncbi:MAG: caspase family protein [Bacteroidia bacterium]|nr:caspase family protein [Bacteroidia bacterium]
MSRLIFLYMALLASPVFAQDNDCSVINIYRVKQMLGSSYNLEVDFDDLKMYELSNGSRMSYKMYTKDFINIKISSTYIFLSASLSLSLEKGNIYYIQVGFDKMTQMPFIKQVDTWAGAQQLNEDDNFKKELVTLEEFIPNQKKKSSNVKQDEDKTETVIDNTPSDVDLNIPENKNENSYRFALIIGNEDYSSCQRDLKSESNVDFAEKDAAVFKEYATKTLGIPADNIIFRINAKALDMDRDIEKMSMLAKNTGGKAEIFFYYAGHGFPDETTKEAFLIPVDVSAADMKYAVSLNSLYAKLTQNPAKRVTVILDACFSGGSRKQGLVSSRGVKIKPKENILKGNLVVFSASSGEQSSLAYKEKKHGMFTYYLLKKLQETKGNVTYKNLSEYLTEKIGVQSIMINSKEQNPQTNISPDIQGSWEGWLFK